MVRSHKVFGPSRPKPGPEVRATTANIGGFGQHRPTPSNIGRSLSRRRLCTASPSNSADTSVRIELIIGLIAGTVGAQLGRDASNIDDPGGRSEVDAGPTAKQSQNTRFYLDLLALESVEPDVLGIVGLRHISSTILSLRCFTIPLPRQCPRPFVLLEVWAPPAPSLPAPLPRLPPPPSPAPPLLHLVGMRCVRL